MDQLNLSDGEELPEEILEKMKKMPVPDELLNFLGAFEQFDVENFCYDTDVDPRPPCSRTVSLGLLNSRWKQAFQFDCKPLFELEKTKKMKWTTTIQRKSAYQRSMEPISISLNYHTTVHQYQKKLKDSSSWGRFSKSVLIGRDVFITSFDESHDLPRIILKTNLREIEGHHWLHFSSDNFDKGQFK